MISKLYPAVSGTRKSDGAEYIVRDAVLIRYSPEDGHDPDYLLVRMSGDMARNAEKEIQVGVAYEFDIKFTVDSFVTKDGRTFPKSVNYVRSLTLPPKATLPPTPSRGGGAEYQPFDQPY